MNGTFQINRGLKIARRLLLDLTEMGLPAAGEFLGLLAVTHTPTKLTGLHRCHLTSVPRRFELLGSHRRTDDRITGPQGAG